MKLVFVVAAALVNPQHQVLIAQRPSHKHMGGLWEFPGGKVEKNEIPEHALIREMKEELGVSVNPQDLEPLTFVSHTYQDFHLFMPLYLVKKWRGEVHYTEHQNIAWVHPHDMGKTFPMPPADEPLVDFLRKFYSYSN